jgi:ribosomal protein S12 methylthiotransferase
VPSVAFVSLGCAKNLVDTEVMIAKLGAAGWRLEPDPGRADTVIVNTCAFIDPAKAESTETILEHASRKRRGQQLIVAGCLAQRYGEQLQALIPEIDGIVGTGAYAGIVELLDDVEAGRRPVRLAFEAEPEHDFLPRLVTTPRATAYLKIAEGCDHPCTFCIIPTLRGQFRSRSMESICAEARALAHGGTKELILIAQDTSMWGRDRGLRRGGLAQLLERLHEIDGIEWIRLLYLYPATVDRELIAAMADLPKVCKYMDMPLQHAHPEVLRAMRRPSNGERYLELIDEFRARVPGMTMRSTFIVGFPGETDSDFAYLLDWLEEAEIDRVGCFKYEPVAGAASNALGSEVADGIKQERWNALMARQQKISARRLKRKIGTRQQVMIDEVGPTVAKGRSKADAPEIDGSVYVTSRRPLRVGEIVTAKIERSDEYDLHGSVAGF